MKSNTAHNYEYSVDLDSNSAAAWVVRMVGENKRVLELGAGPGSITRHLKGAGKCNIVALEVAEDAIVKLAPFCEKVYQADLNDSAWPACLQAHGKFDVVVAADVLEHVYDPWLTLKTMSNLINDQGCVVVSLPHVGHSAVAACLLNEDFDYRDWGLLDRTHIRFFGMKNIQTLFNKAGLNIIEAQCVIVPPEITEFANHWRSLPTQVREALSTCKFGEVYQVVIKAVPATRATKNIDLMNLSIKHLEKLPVSRIKAFVKKYIPVRYHKRLRGLARKLDIKG